MLRTSVRMIARAPAVTRRTLSRNGSSSSSNDAVGLGYTSEVLEGVSRLNLVREMMAAIDHPARTIPGVSSVTVQPALGDAGMDGALWRRMVVDGETIVEHIYANPTLGTVRRIALRTDGKEGDLEIVNHLRVKDGALRIEVYQRDQHTLEREFYSMPLASATFTIEATVALARAKEAQEQDACFHANKA